MATWCLVLAVEKVQGLSLMGCVGMFRYDLHGCIGDQVVESPL